MVENQIDRLCISSKFRTTLLDVRAMRGADASSEHHLLVGTLQLKLKRSGKYVASRVKYDVNSLKDPLFPTNFLSPPGINTKPSKICRILEIH